MVVVLDSNILVSAFLSKKGEDAKVLREAKEHKLYLSPFILQEVYTSLHYPRIPSALNIQMPTLTIILSN